MGKDGTFHPIPFLKGDKVTARLVAKILTAALSKAGTYACRVAGEDDNHLPMSVCVCNFASVLNVRVQGSISSVPSLTHFLCLLCFTIIYSTHSLCITTTVKFKTRCFCRLSEVTVVARGYLLINTKELNT